jgi:hypothetical protein
VHARGWALPFCGRNDAGKIDEREADSLTMENVAPEEQVSFKGFYLKDAAWSV